MDSTNKISKSGAETRRLLLKAKDVCELLAGINKRTLSRIEARGLIRSVPLLRHKMYAREDVDTLIAKLRDWKSEGTR